MKGSEKMKKLLIFILIGATAVLFSVKKPVENTQSKTVIIKQNIGLPNNAVKKLNDFLKP